MSNPEYDPADEDEMRRFKAKVVTRLHADSITRDFPPPFHREFRTFEVHQLTPDMWNTINTFHFRDEEAARQAINHAKALLGEEPIPKPEPTVPRPPVFVEDDPPANRDHTDL